MAAITEPAPALKAALERQRTRFNTMFIQAKQSKSQLDASAFMEHLRNTIEPIIERIQESEPSAVDKSLAVLYETSLQLMASNLLFNTSKYQAIDYGWKNIFPNLAHLLSQSPQHFVGAVTNALYNLDQSQCADYESWCSKLIEIGQRTQSLEITLEAGKVLAWQAGLAHYRQSALDAVLSLPTHAALFSLGFENSKVEMSVAEIVQRARNTPWVKPAAMVTAAACKSQLHMAARLGEFRGLGGNFLRPPIVSLRDEDFHLTDGENSWILSSDIFGTTLKQTAFESFSASQVDSSEG